MKLGNNMGTYLNPGRRRYQIAVNSEIYVDKSQMINYLNTLVNTSQRYVSVSRPRRFGKTMAADMVCAYYGREADSKELFSNLMLAKKENDCSDISWDEYIGKFDVIRIVMTKFFKNKRTVDDGLKNLQRLVVRDIKKEYPDIDYFNEEDLVQTLDDVYSVNERQVVIVIDEWDAVFRIFQNDKEGQKEYLDFLRDLLKDNDSIALAYITGILPIKKYGERSALNMFTEYSMIFPRQLARFAGFTKEEVKNECSKYGRDFSEVSKWYDGYEVSDIIPPNMDDTESDNKNNNAEAKKYSIYSPLSVVEAMTTGKIKNYWNATETYEALAEYIRKDYDGLKDAVALLMDGGRIKIDTSTYQNDMTTFNGRDDILSLLIHLGYLGYEDEKSEVYIPNREILEVFKISTKSDVTY